jgi:hypothetical protein
VLSFGDGFYGNKSTIFRRRKVAGETNAAGERGVAGCGWRAAPALQGQPGRGDTGDLASLLEKEKRQLGEGEGEAAVEGSRAIAVTR